MNTSHDEQVERARLASALPILEWLRGYQKDWLRPDVIAVLTAAAVVIPKAMAYALQVVAESAVSLKGPRPITPQSMCSPGLSSSFLTRNGKFTTYVLNVEVTRPTVVLDLGFNF